MCGKYHYSMLPDSYKKWLLTKQSAEVIIDERQDFVLTGKKKNWSQYDFSQNSSRTKSLTKKK